MRLSTSLLSFTKATSTSYKVTAVLRIVFYHLTAGKVRPVLARHSENNAVSLSKPRRREIKQLLSKWNVSVSFSIPYTTVYN